MSWRVAMKRSQTRTPANASSPSSFALCVNPVAILYLHLTKKKLNAKLSNFGWKLSVHSLQRAVLKSQVHPRGKSILPNQTWNKSLWCYIPMHERALSFTLLAGYFLQKSTCCSFAISCSLSLQSKAWGQKPKTSNSHSQKKWPQRNVLKLKEIILLVVDVITKGLRFIPSSVEAGKGHSSQSHCLCTNCLHFSRQMACQRSYCHPQVSPHTDAINKKFSFGQLWCNGHSWKLSVAMKYYNKIVHF